MAFGLGCAAGCLSHTALAVAGISALIAASPVAFGVLRLLGGGYLIWLAIGALRKSGKAFSPTFAATRPRTVHRYFIKGLIANAMNPKVILFFLAFLPQFVERDGYSAALQTAILGVLFTLQAAVLFGALGWFSGRVGSHLQRNPKVALWLERIAGVVFAVVGLRLLIEEANAWL